jgi:hypothetical protein
MALGMADIGTPRLHAAEWPMVERVDHQPLAAQLTRLRETLTHLGQPLPQEIVGKLDELDPKLEDASYTQAVQAILDPHCLTAVAITADGKPQVTPRLGMHSLVEQGWRAYLVKVVNPAGSRGQLRIDSPQAKPLPHAPADEVASRWLGVTMFDGQPLTPKLTGLPLEYRIVELYARDAGPRSAQLEFAVPRLAKDAADRTGSLLADWRFDRDTAGWVAEHDVTLTSRDGALHVAGTGDDPYFMAKLPTPARPGRFVLRFWARAESGGFGQVFWWSEERGQPSGQFATSFAVDGGRERMYEIPFREGEHLAGVRIDPPGKDARWRIDWIELAYADVGADWGGAAFDFDVHPSQLVTFHVTDEPGLPTMGCFEITDQLGRVYPPQSKRLAPDFFFQRQIYRGTRETVRLPAGTYTVHCSRGPETIPEVQTLTVGSQPVDLAYTVRRWVDPSDRGYWSGDHHIHAAGCAHYEQPTQGVHPPDMARHCLGEDLKVGCCLTWGPCFDYQKRFFTGKPDDQSRYPYLLRYDIEVSGFGSHVSGHLNLLRLQEQIPAGGDSKDHWPTLGLNTLRWAKRQGAVCGPAHSASGLTRHIDRVPETDGQDGPFGLPTFNIPAFDGIGANEFIMNVPHLVEGPAGTQVPAVDFISTMDTDRVAELNIWYHVLNCGFRVRASGETDFPCISGERVGLGRVYARVDGTLEFDRWCDAIAAGRSYVSDGRTHLMEFTAASTVEPDRRQEIGVGTSELHLAAPDTLKFDVIAAGRYDDGRTLPVELIVNGYPVMTREIVADGREHRLTFEHEFPKSGWAAIRVFPSAHTNPLFVIVDDQPIRANRASAAWCLRSLEQCWKAKQGSYRGEERQQAERDYQTAREVYQKILAESPE